MEPPRTIQLPDGRALAFDDVGDADGAPVIYLHGTPDSRLARHPDDRIAARCGVRLLAVDRPGSGDSDPHPQSRLGDLGHDLRCLVDELGVRRAAMLGWSAGGLFALAAATVLGDRVTTVTVVGTLPPVEAYRSAALVAALGPERRPFVELAREVAAGELAAEVAPYLVPEPLTSALASAHVLEAAGDQGRAELAAVPGAAEALAAALMASVRQGAGCLEHDVALQLEAGLDLREVTAPVRLVHGAQDGVSPPEVGAWLRDRLPDACLEVLPEAGHHLLFPRWEQLLEGLATADER